MVPSCRSLLISALCLVTIAPLTPASTGGSLSDYTSIRKGMTKLSPLVGRWHAVALFHDGNQVTENDGTYDIEWALEETYLEYRVELHSKDEPSRHHGFIIYVTYNPATQQYESTYFYTRWAMRVSETGEFDDAASEFRTKAFIPLEDGVHDENVRTVTELKDAHKIVYNHYSRYSHQTAERMDVQITLTRE